MLIRPAHTGDAAALAPLFSDWAHPQPPELIAERLAAWSAAPHAEVLVAELDRRLAGLVAVSASLHLARPGRFGRLVGLAVGSEFRRRGVGAALVHAAEELARSWGCDRLEVTSSRWRDTAPKFYVALGYRDQSERQGRYLRPL